MRRRDFGIRVGALPAALPFTAAAAGTELIKIPFAEEGSACAAAIERRPRRTLTLFTPMNGEGTVYLMDLNGKIVHTWECRTTRTVRISDREGNAFLEWQDSHRFVSRTDAFQRRRRIRGGLERPDSLGRSRGRSSLRWAAC